MGLSWMLKVPSLQAAIIFALSNFKNSSHLAQLLKEIFQHERRNHHNDQSKNNKKQDHQFLIRLSLLVLGMGIVTPVTMIILVPTVYFLNLGILPFRMIEGLFATVEGWSDFSFTVIRITSFCFDLFFITTIDLNGLPILTHFLAFSILYVISRLDNIQR
jgi:hypothetical protein